VHDLNNQLAVILNFTTFVLEDTAADDPRREDLLEVLHAAERARDLVQQLLAETPRD
jgi:signal transduction histidine kinase